MSYTIKRFPNQPNQFPEPPHWLLWQGWQKWDHAARAYRDDGEGQIRHYDSLQKAKKRAAPYGGGKFAIDWAIYHWDGTEYVLQYEGFAGEKKEDNPLWQMKVPKQVLVPRDMVEVETRVSEREQAAINKAIASIVGS